MTLKFARSLHSHLSLICACRFPESGGSAIYLCGSGDQGLPFIASQRRQYNDSDLETEAEMPPTDNIIAKDILRKLKPKERKRQDVINGKKTDFMSRF
jgi:hypothetical protein